MLLSFDQRSLGGFTRLPVRGKEVKVICFIQMGFERRSTRYLQLGGSCGVKRSLLLEGVLKPMLLLAFIITLTHPSQFSLCSVRQMYIQWWSNEELPWSNLTMLTVIGASPES